MDLRSRLTGPGPVLPPVLDGVAERWAAAGQRVRIAVMGAVMGLLIATAGLGAARSPWGPATDVLVAARDLAVGEVVTGDDLTVQRWPAAIVPVGAVSLAAAIGATVTTGAPAGTAVVSGHLGDGGITAALGPGRAAYPLVVPGPLAVEVGGRVDIVGRDDVGGGAVLATDATVLAIDTATDAFGSGTTVWLDIARSDAPRLAGASAWGELTLVALPRHR